MLTRRDLLKAAPAFLAAPRVARAQSASDRQFLFIYAMGGWDTFAAFTPAFDAPLVDMEPGAEPGRAGDLVYVDHADRPEVRAFMEAYGSRACVLNGIEVRSVTHERCRKLLFTGQSDSAGDDWAAIIAGHGGDALVLPHLVISGPSFASRYTSRVVRVGADGQLVRLVDGSAIFGSEVRVNPLPPASAGSVDRFLRARLAAEAEGSGRRGAMAAGYAEALDSAARLGAVGATVDLAPEWDGCHRNIASDAATAFDCFEQGLSRCAITQSAGWCEIGWDTHDNALRDQSRNFALLFRQLNEVMADLDSRVAIDGTPLAERVTIVVISEMGRTPQVNAAEGRDHWTYTSAMLIGAGVRGGRSVGSLDENGLGRPIDLATGDETDSGTGLVAGHLGATLLRMADVDPAGFLPQYEPVTAVIDG